MYLFCNSRIHVITLYSGHICVYYASMLWCWLLVWILVRTGQPCLGVGCHSSLLVVGVIAKLHHLLQQSVETESKEINVIIWLEGQVFPLLAKCMQCGLAGAVAVDACRSDDIPSLLGSPLLGKR
jgi:hypothetical protein